jgi:hypothetical protein
MEDAGDSYEFDHGTIVRIAESVRFTENFNRNPRLYNMKFAFELLTDANNGQAMAKVMSQDEVVIIQNPALLKYKWGALDGAKAGYQGDCNAFANHFYFDQGPCVVKCFTAGTVDGGSPPTGMVGESYSHTVTSSGLEEDSLEIEGLPPGLTANAAGNITGTPTEAGQFFVTASGQAPKTGPIPFSASELCTVTIGFVIKIEEAEEETPSPDPEVGGS